MNVKLRVHANKRRPRFAGPGRDRRRAGWRWTWMIAAVLSAGVPSSATATTQPPPEASPAAPPPADDPPSPSPAGLPPSTSSPESSKSSTAGHDRGVRRGLIAGTVLSSIGLAVGVSSATLGYVWVRTDTSGHACLHCSIMMGLGANLAVAGTISTTIFATRLRRHERARVAPTGPSHATPLSVANPAASEAANSDFGALDPVYWRAFHEDEHERAHSHVTAGALVSALGGFPLLIGINTAVEERGYDALIYRGAITGATVGLGSTVSIVSAARLRYARSVLDDSVISTRGQELRRARTLSGIGWLVAAAGGIMATSGLWFTASTSAPRDVWIPAATIVGPTLLASGLTMGTLGANRRRRLKRHATTTSFIVLPTLRGVVVGVAGRF